MKYALIALTLLPTLAHADFNCKSVEQGPDHGYFVSSNDEGQAEVTMQSIAGPQHLATLDCVTPEYDGHPNVPHAIQICGDNRPGGYKFTITAGGFAGISATLSQASVRGKRIPMVCRLK